MKLEQARLEHFFTDRVAATPKATAKRAVTAEQAETKACLEAAPTSTRNPEQHVKALSVKHGVPGLSLIESFVTASEEGRILSFLDTQTWRTDLCRRTIHYGGTYCLLPPRSSTQEEKKKIERTVIKADPIPADLHFVVDRMVQHGLHAESDRPQFCIVNEYKGDQGISAHVENFRFGEPVCGLTLGSGDYIRFHELQQPDDGSVRSGRASRAWRTGRKVDVWLPSRSLLVMTKDARTRWQHEIVRRRRGRMGEGWRRVSLTFRSLQRNDTRGGGLST